MLWRDVTRKARICKNEGLVNHSFFHLVISYGFLSGSIFGYAFSCLSPGREFHVCFWYFSLNAH